MAEVAEPADVVHVKVGQDHRHDAGHVVREGNAALLASLFIGALLRPMMLAEFADAHSFTLTREHDAVIEAACIALLEAERAHDR